MRLKA